MSQPITTSVKRLIRAAIAAAGTAPEIAPKLGIGSAAIYRWISRGRIPSEYIKPICEMGGNAITPDQILDALTREAGKKVAA